jgi:hypothetical protein
LETDPTQLAESFGLNGVSRDGIVIPAQLKRVAVMPIFFAAVAGVSVLMILHPENFSFAPVLIGCAAAAYAAPMLALSMMDLFRGGPQISLTPFGFTIHRQLWKSAYQWEDVGSFGVEETKLYGFIRLRWVSFEDRAPEERSWLRRLLGRRESLLKSPAGNLYPYAISPENLVRLLNANVARYGAISSF